VYHGRVYGHLRPTNIAIRIPAEISIKLRTLAKQPDRSLNGEIVRALRNYIDEYSEQHHGEKEP
jgi:predicted transcriptional regulator